MVAEAVATATWAGMTWNSSTVPSTMAAAARLNSWQSGRREHQARDDPEEPSKGLSHR